MVFVQHLRLDWYVFVIDGLPVLIACKEIRSIFLSLALSKDRPYLRNAEIGGVGS